jgi:hypothetical protein
MKAIPHGAFVVIEASLANRVGNDHDPARTSQPTPEEVSGLVGTSISATSPPTPMKPAMPTNDSPRANLISSLAIIRRSLAGFLLMAGLPLAALSQSTYTPYSFTTLAGLCGVGSTDGAGSAAKFYSPYGVAVDGAGNAYVADSGNYTIRKITPAGVVTTLAGLAGNRSFVDGTGNAARFYYPIAVAVDNAGNVYVVDDDTIRKVTPAGLVTTLAGVAGSEGSADGTGSAARFKFPNGVAVDTAGNVYVADMMNNTIRKITPAGVVTTLAGLAGNPGIGDGTGAAAKFFWPSGVAVDGMGVVYVSDEGSYTIRKVTPAGVVTTLAGGGSPGSADGTGSAAGFHNAAGVAVDGAGNVYVSDSYENTIRKVTPAGVVTTLAGMAQTPSGIDLGIDGPGMIDNYGSADGTGSAARFYNPNGVAVDTAGNVLVADTNNETIRKVTPAGVVTTLAGLAAWGSADGTGSAARFQGPEGVAVDTAGSVYVADYSNSTIRKITPTGVVTTMAGLARNPGSDDGTGSAAKFCLPEGVAVDSLGNVYVADTYNYTIRKITPAGLVTTLAGLPGSYGSADGTGSTARFYNPASVAVDSTGNVYVADEENSTIRKITPAGVVTTLAGLAGSSGSADGTGSAARFFGPYGVAVDAAGCVYVADRYNNTIRKITLTGVVTTLAGSATIQGSADGTGSAARFSGPTGVAVDAAGNVYVTDSRNCTIRKITPAGVVTTLAGLATSWGSADGTGSAARFNFTQGVAVDSAGNVYVGDSGGNTVRKGVPMIATQPLSQAVIAGQTASFTVVALGTSTYQWYFNGNPIPGATTATLTITGAQPANAGTYSVTVTNASGSMPSNAVILTVNVPPSISAPPASITVTQGQSASFSVVAAGTAPFSYQWQKNGIAISGATSATLTMGSVQLTDAGNYTVLVTNAASSVTSAGALLTVYAAPIISTSPASITVTQGQSASFSVVATGVPALTYQWKKDGVAISGATSASYGIANALLADAGSYSCVVANAMSSVTSGFATLTVNASPSIKTPPESQTAAVGTDVTLAVSVTGTAPLNYQWKKDGAVLVGLTGPTLILRNVTTADAGSYAVVVTNAFGIANSNAAVLTVNWAPGITTQPFGVIVNPGQNAAFTVVAVGPAPLAYQWSKNGAALAGATAATLALNNVRSTNAGSYTVTVTSAGGSITSAAAILTINAAPVITTQPRIQTAMTGNAVSFSVVATGSPAPTYQWRKNGTALGGSAATNATFTIASVQAADAGNYDVVVTNPYGVATSSVAQLTVSTTTSAPVITAQPVSQTALANNPVTITVAATGAPAPSYQWRKNATTLNGQTNANLTLASVQPADAGNYDVIVSNSVGTVTSSAATLGVIRHSYAGVYFGSFGPGLGNFAIYVDTDNTGVFVGYLPGASVAFVNFGLTVDDNGNFTVGGAQTGTTSAAADQLDNAAGNYSMATVGIALNGALAGDGSVSGTVTGIAGTQIAGARSADVGTTQSFAGCYQGSVSANASTVVTIVDASGRAFALIQTATTADGNTGTVDSAGHIAVNTGKQTITATVAADTSVLAATATDSKGQTVTFAGASETVLANQRLASISTRAQIGTGDAVAIAGFIISGQESKPVLIRAVGPTLGTFGVSGTLAATKLDLYRGSTLIASNTGWTTAGNTDTIIATAARSGAFSLIPGSADSVLLMTLAPGLYSAVVSGVGNTDGVGMVEVYDLSAAMVGQKLVGISTRAFAGTGDNMLIAGVYVSGAVSKRVLVRAIGPGLTQFGVTGVLAQPQLTLFRGNQIIAQNTGWGTSSDASTLATAAIQANTFALTPGSLDAALIASLDPGVPYTAQVTGVGGISGNCLVEIYELP